MIPWIQGFAIYCNPSPTTHPLCLRQQKKAIMPARFFWPELYGIGHPESVSSVLTRLDKACYGIKRSQAPSNGLVGSKSCFRRTPSTSHSRFNTIGGKYRIGFAQKSNCCLSHTGITNSHSDSFLPFQVVSLGPYLKAVGFPGRIDPRDSRRDLTTTR